MSYEQNDTTYVSSLLMSATFSRAYCLCHQFTHCQPSGWSLTDQPAGSFCLSQANTSAGKVLPWVGIEHRSPAWQSVTLCIMPCHTWLLAKLLTDFFFLNRPIWHQVLTSHISINLMPNWPTFTLDWFQLLPRHRSTTQSTATLALCYAERLLSWPFC